MELIDFNSSEDEPPVNFFLSSLEEQIHVELKDLDAKLTQSKSEGRVLLEIQEDLLANFLDGLQERREDVKCRPEHQRLQKEICSLKAQLTTSVSEVKFLNNKLTKICPMLRNAQKDLVEQTSTITNQQIAFESMKADKEALQSELQIIKPMVGLYKTNVELELESLLELERADTGQISAALKKAEDLLANERLRFQQEINTLQDLVKQSSIKRDQQLKLKQEKAENYALQRELQALRQMHKKTKLELESHLESERAETRKITTALKKVEDLLLTECFKFEKDTTTLQDLVRQTSMNRDQQKADKEALQCELSAIKPMLALSKTNLELELESHLTETRKITTALEKAEDLLATECLKFQKDTTTLQDLVRQTSMNSDQLKADKEALQCELSAIKPLLALSKSNLELELESHLTETRKITTALEKAEDLLATECLKFQKETKTLQDLVRQTSMNRDQQKADKEALQCELSAIKPMLALSKANLELELESHLAETRKISAAQKKAEDNLQTERLRFEREITDLQETEKSKLTSLAQLEAKSIKLMDALNDAEQDLQTNNLQWQEEKTFLTAKLEVSHVIHLAQLKVQESENETIISALQKKAEDQLKSDRFLWQQEKESLLEKAVKTKTSYMAQLEEQKQATTKCMDNLKEAVQNMQSYCTQLDEERLTILRDKNRLKYDQLKKRQEWQKAESDLKSQIESQVLPKKQKKHWFKWQQDRPTLPQPSNHVLQTLQKKEQQWDSCKSTLLQASLRLERHMQEKEQECQEEKLHLLQTTDMLKSHLQMKEQEWQRAESSLKSQLTDLQSQISKKKKEKPWFKGFF